MTLHTGNVLILGIGLFAAAAAKTTDPSKVGVVLSYALGSTCFTVNQAFVSSPHPLSYPGLL
jgi:hypothetical protein